MQCSQVFLIHVGFSYQVPKEVGKVGTESPTFIQPIAERKDGIQAMFAKQSAATSSQSFKGAKRKRSASPPKLSSPAKSVKQDHPEQMQSLESKLNTWEDDSEIEYVDPPSHMEKVTIPSRSLCRSLSERVTRRN